MSTPKIPRTGSAVDVLKSLRHELHHHAKGTELEVLRELVLHADRTGATFVYASTIARRIGRSVTTIYLALAKLRARGVIESECKATRNGRSNLYRVLLGRPAATRVDVCEVEGRVVAALNDPPPVAPYSDRIQDNAPPLVPQAEPDPIAEFLGERFDGPTEEREELRAEGVSASTVSPSEKSHKGQNGECERSLAYWFARCFPLLPQEPSLYASADNVAELRRSGMSAEVWRLVVDGALLDRVHGDPSKGFMRRVSMLVKHRHHLASLAIGAQRASERRREERKPTKHEPIDDNAQRAAAAALCAHLGVAA